MITQYLPESNGRTVSVTQLTTNDEFVTDILYKNSDDEQYLKTLSHLFRQLLQFDTKLLYYQIVSNITISLHCTHSL